MKEYMVTLFDPVSNETWKQSYCSREDVDGAEMNVRQNAQLYGWELRKIEQDGPVLR